MCDHCSKVTSQKGYAGQVTCRCDLGDKREHIHAHAQREMPREKVKEKSKDMDKDMGCCSKKEKRRADGCCGAACCPGTKSTSGKCCEEMSQNVSTPGDVKGISKNNGDKGCCEARELAGGCCKSGCCADAKGRNSRDEQHSRK